MQIAVTYAIIVPNSFFLPSFLFLLLFSLNPTHKLFYNTYLFGMYCGSDTMLDTRIISNKYSSKFRRSLTTHTKLKIKL